MNECGCHSVAKGVREDIGAGVEAAARPFRKPEQEQQARKVSYAVLKVISNWERELWKIIEGMAKQRGASFPPLVLMKARTYPDDIEAITALFNVATPEELRALEALFDSFGLNMRESFERVVKETYQQGLDLAYEDMSRYAGRQDPERFASVSEVYPFSEASPFYRSFASSGLDLVRDKVSVQMKGKVYQRLANAIASGRNWQEMAEDLHNNVGLGLRGRNHWTRIVRTEMGFAYEYSQRERYQDAGIEYVRRSLSNGACPRCRALSGVWPAQDAPRLIVHPNCRCSYLPFYRLPKGSGVRSKSELSESASRDAGYAQAL